MYREGVLVEMYLVQDEKKRSTGGERTQGAGGRVEAAVSGDGLCGAGGEHRVRWSRGFRSMGTTGTDVTRAADLLVRVIAREDAAAVAELSRELGYEVSVEMVAEQIGRVSSRAGNQIAFVACIGCDVVGWIEATITYHLQYFPYSLIGGLVVREGMRGLGIGKRLCAEVEAWSKEKGVGVVRVTSRSTRGDAHRFYIRDGYERIKTSAVFEKVLP